MDKLIGKTLGQYHIEAKIGQGGMAAVFRAYQPTLERYVAIKVLPPHFAAKNPNFVKRFRREARAIARLNHPNILPIFDFGVEQDYSYIVMRYVENARTLAGQLARAVRLEQHLDLIDQVSQALAYAHRHHIVHRDVKPSNILIDGGWALLSDFGVAKFEEPVTTRLTDTGHRLGTAAYMAPEQAKDEATDYRADIFALGVIAYEILTGVIPHDAPSQLTLLLKRTTEPPLPPSQLNPNIPPAVEWVILRALALHPEERFDQATDFATALKQAVAASNLLEETWPIVSDTTDQTTKPRARVKVTPPTFPIAPFPVAGQPATPSDKNSDPARPVTLWLALFSAVLAVGVLSAWVGGAFNSTAEGGRVTRSPLPVATTATPSPSPTASPSPTPTDTPPPPTSTPTAKSPTITPSPTLLPPSPTATERATATPTVTQRPSPSPEPARPEATPTLLKPLSVDDELSFGPTDFEWQWPGEMPPDFGFEVRVWREGEPPAGVHDAVLDNRQGRIEQIGPDRYRLRVDIREAAGVRGRTGLYWWTVAVVQISPAYAEVGLAAEPIYLRFEAGGSGSGRNDGDSGNPGGGIN